MVEARLSWILLRPLARAIARLGGDADLFIRKIGLSDESDPNASAPGSRVDEALEDIARAFGTDCLGLHLALACPTGTLGLLDYGLLTSSNLRDAITRQVRWYRIVSERTALTFDTRRDPVRLCASRPANVSSGVVVEFAFAVFVLRTREALGGSLPLRGVRFRHRGTAGALHKSIFDAPVQFLQTVNEIAIDARALDLPFGTADPATMASLDEFVVRKEAELKAERSPLLDRARAALSMNVANAAYGMDDLAKQLRLSPRTLQRQLRAAGTSHRELLDTVRRDFALEIVEHEELSPEQVAERLGFAGSRPFYRAFLRWTGMTPGDYRASRRQPA